ncbi:cyclase family protein [Diaphorobacter sp. HDW4A]|uniref:cyclase family protein n=1 Tax=Diaphorobacter sp. HDW4A TaxID=2714924 RepID=UPI00140A11BC|nr:cyclase family protein [Diaphorobacter sp. HDW4A]QIL79743.1 cyclase family protein [Diaphorobacter sp. HDW4A]
MPPNAARFLRRPQGSNWGDFGADDQLGTLNHLTPKQRLAASAEIREGISFSLSLPLNVPRAPVLNPRRKGPVIRPAQKNGVPVYRLPLEHDTPGATDVISDDSVTLSPQYSTQWDALAHVGSMFNARGDGHATPTGYNGFVVSAPTPAEGQEFKGTEHLSIAPMAQHGIQGRGVMVNLRRHFGDAPRKVGLADLQGIFHSDGIEVRPGDILCLHTGLADLALTLADDEQQRLKTSCCVLDGSDSALLQWITDSRIAAIAADNHAVERRNHSLTIERGPLLPLHEHCLFKLGLPLGELWHLTPLASWLDAHQRHAFFLTAAPMYLPGLVGAPVNPIATV